MQEEMGHPQGNSYDVLATLLVQNGALDRMFENSLHTPCEEKNLSQLIYPRYPVECVEVPCKSSKKMKFLVVAWPVVLEHLAKTPRGSGQETPLSQARTHLRAALAAAPGAALELAKSAAYSLERLFPPGSRVAEHCLRGMDDFRGRMTARTHFRGAGLNDTVVSIYAFPYLTASIPKKLSQSLDLFTPINSTNLLALDPKLFSSGPVVLHVLYHALRRARENPLIPPATWGLIWAPTQLIFNVRQALMRLEEAGDLELYFNDRTAADLFLLMKKPMPGVRRFRDSRIPSLSRMAFFQKEFTLPQKRWIDDLHAFSGVPGRWQDAEDYVVFPYEGEQTFLGYFDALRRYPATELPALRRLPSKRSFEAEEDVTPAERPRYEGLCPVTFNACVWGYIPNDSEAMYVPMTPQLLTLRGRYYVSFPKEMVLRLPLAQATSQNPLRQFATEDRVELRSEGVFIEACQLHANAPVAVFLREACESLKNKEDREYLRIFLDFGNWINEYTDYFDGVYPWCAISTGRVYAHQYPNPFDTLEKRMNYLRYKGECSRKRDLRIVGSDLRGARSGRISDYDRFVFWYVANYELPTQKFWLQREEYAKYMTHRWMPWRRYGGNLAHLVQVPGWPSLDLHHAVPTSTDKHLVKDAVSLVRSMADKCEHELPFTLEQPRTKGLVGRYVYEQDAL